MRMGNSVQPSKNQIPLGIIGSQSFVQRTLAVIQAFPSFSPVPVIIAGDEESAAAARELAGKVEVFLLPSPHLLRRVKEAVGPGIPAHHVPVTDAGLSQTMFRALRAGCLSGGISIDTLLEKMVVRTFKELGVPECNFIVYDGPAYAFNDELVAFHKEAAASRGCSVAFTAVESVSLELDGLGIPNERLVPSDQDIVVTLERALLSTESRRSKESQNVVGILNVDHFGKLAVHHGNEHEVQKLKLDIHRMVLDYVESLDGYLTHLGGDEYLFFTTRGIFERETGGYKTIPLAKEAGKSLNITFSIGIGFGTTANAAGTHARMALRKSKEAGGNTCFIVREDRSLIGPLETAAPVLHVLSPTDESLIRRAEEAGMTSAYLSRLLQNKARTGKSEYMAHELAALLDITLRSAHRLLLNWIDGGLAVISGVQKVPKGRPRQQFKFVFLSE